MANCVPVEILSFRGHHLVKMIYLKKGILSPTKVNVNPIKWSLDQVYIPSEGVV